jgi:hypothetical protein|tara:strand:- start:224 stop:436 length:213 start_codon:yes stop_codon:yes gene_type:complete
MDPIQALEMLSQVVKGARLPYSEHVLLERSVDVLRTAISETAEASEEAEPVVFEETAASKTPRRGERRQK